jgi:hypothetical protein
MPRGSGVVAAIDAARDTVLILLLDAFAMRRLALVLIKPSRDRAPQKCFALTKE